MQQVTGILTGLSVRVKCKETAVPVRGRGGP
jgi:hypothetical protein